jgi:hypothetical protein
MGSVATQLGSYQHRGNNSGIITIATNMHEKISNKF